ncbi:MAG: glycosyltransferase family 4 protein [Dehalococcoidia bacterium]|nr:glycosyltransferase family 4 protein [Dehalococcoidia bacterium]
MAPTSFFADYGCHVRIYEESRALQRLGHRVTVVTYHRGNDVPNLPIARAWGLRRSPKLGSYRRKPLYDLLLLLRALQVAASIRPTMIHAHLHEGALIGGIVSAIFRVPLVFDFQGSLVSEMVDHRFLSTESRWYPAMQWLERVINRLPDAIITSSRNAADILLRDFGVSPARVATVPDAVNPDVFVPRWLHRDPARLEALRARWGVPSDVPVVVYLGLLSEYQGTSKLLEAAAALKARGVPAHFLVMGFPGEDTYSLVAEALGVADRVTFTGRAPYLEAPDYLLLGDVAVSPKMSETEGNGKLLNYQACGLPTVTFDTPVAREILGDLGVYARTGDPIALADALQSLLADPAERDRRGRALRERVVATQTWDQGIEHVLKIYRIAAMPRSRR